MVWFRPVRKRQERRKRVTEGPDSIEKPKAFLAQCLLCSSAIGPLGLPVPSRNLSSASGKVRLCTVCS